MTYRGFVVTALLAAAVIVVPGAAGDPGNGEHKKLDKIQHIVVIYEENHSFDNLYGNWPGVNGRANAVPANTTRALSASSEPGGNAAANSSGNAWVLNQTPLSAISLAVWSSIRCPCSMHFTPAAMDRWIAVGVKACATT